MTTARRGIHQVTCRECGASGTLSIGNPRENGKYKVQDSVPHRTTCSFFVGVQARHLKQKRAWQRQEERANALVGARSTLASGAVNQDGDGRLFHGWRTESKQTSTPYFDLFPRIWMKLLTGALPAGEEPLLHVELRHRMPPERRVVIRLEMFQSLSDTEVVKKPGNRVSHRVRSDNPTPLLIPFEHPGVELYEHELRLLLQDPP